MLLSATGWLGALCAAIPGTAWSGEPTLAAGVAQQGHLLQRPATVVKLQSQDERLEMTVHTSHILTLEGRIVQVQVDNPEFLDVTPLSPNQLQVSAKAVGVTRLTLWNEDKRIYNVDVIIFGDTRALSLLLQSQFPNASLKVIPVANGALISGTVDNPEHINTIMQIALEYYPKVINNITVSGVQKVLLHCKVMEVSRTKLRRCGFDFAQISSGGFVGSGISGLIRSVSAGGITRSAADSTFSFGVINGNNSFFGLLDALREDKLAKVLAEPTLIAINGKAAYFKVGGEFAYIKAVDNNGIPQIDWKEYNTRLDFVPIILGPDRIRLEVRPHVSEIDKVNAVNNIPSVKYRELETAVEMRPGETLALGGLLQQRIDAVNRGLPWVSDVPYLGAAFRKTEHAINEVELLILVTPELAESLTPEQAQLCGPGMRTTSPNDFELYMLGHLEVPNCCPNGDPQCNSCAGGNGGNGNGVSRGTKDVAPGMIGPAEILPGAAIDQSSRAKPSRGGASQRMAQPGSPPTPGPSTSQRPSNSNNPYIARDQQNPRVRGSAATAVRAVGNDAEAGFIGPVGYHVLD
jgi:pilus assembly protein CpaC